MRTYEERYGLDPMLLDRLEDTARRAVEPGTPEGGDFLLALQDCMEAVEEAKREQE